MTRTRASAKQAGARFERIIKRRGISDPGQQGVYMRHAIRMVLRAEGIALLPGWENSRGARLEWQIGSELGLDVRDFADWTAA